MTPTPISGFTPQTLAQYFDQTLLKPYVSDNEIIEFFKEGLKYNFKSMMVSSACVGKCKPLLEGSKILLGCTAGFPLGQTTIEAKVFEAKQAIENGVDEIDYVINIIELKSGNLQYIKNEMQHIVSICRERNAVSKVIFENCYLTKYEIEALCSIALEIKPDFIKTSTGFGTGGATFDDIKFMKKCVGDNIKIKAAGGIRDLETTLKMIQSGADRIGTSSGANIINDAFS